MKIATPLTLVSSLLIVVGCARERSGQYSESNYSPAYGSAGTSTYSSGATVSSTNSSQTTVNRPATTYQAPASTLSTNEQAQTSTPSGRLYHESTSTTTADTTSPATSEITNRFDTAATSTNQSTVTGQNQDLTPTSQRPDAASRIYSTNQSNIGGTSDLYSTNIQGLTEADRSLGQKVIQELRTDTSLASTLPMVKVSVDSGKVTMTGTVKNEDEKTKIESAVQRVTGVSSVDNQLQVTTNSGATEK